MILRNAFLFLSILLFCNKITAQQGSIFIYYSPVSMPSLMKNDYFGKFDTKLLAEDLAALLSKATGQAFIVKEHVSGAEKGIFLLLDSSMSDPCNEAGNLESNGKSFIRIRARYTTGISYTMYSWLEQLGFHFYLPGDDWTTIPLIRDIFEKKILKKTYRPFFKLRMFNASGGIFPVKGLDENSRNSKDWDLWHLRNRMGSDYNSIDGHVGEYFNMVHRQEMEKDAGILAPVNGKRQYSVEGKLDPTYQKGVTMFADWIVEEFKNYRKRLPGFLPYKKYYSADAGDGLNYCHTPECESRFRSVSDQVFSITNEVARKIRQTDPRAGISTLAYTERADTPSFRIEPNVHVQVVPTGFQSVSTAAGLMQRWAKKTPHVSQYDFLNIGVWAYDMPFYNLYQYHRNLQFLQTLKIEGMNFETSFSKFASGIQQYFILKYLCDPYVSMDKLLGEFCSNNFGKAAPPLKSLLKEWYFNNTHLNTGYDKTSFYPEELGRFIQYLVDAENTDGISLPVKSRIEELKAYTVYLCMFYEFFNDLKVTESFATSPSIRAAKATEMLEYTWSLYDSKIFHNTQLNDMLKQYLPDQKKEDWDFRNSDQFRNITKDFPRLVQEKFEIMKKKYLPEATKDPMVSDELLERIASLSADSIHINTTDELSFGNYLYPLEFYCAAPGLLKIAYQADTSQLSNPRKNKIAIIGVESADYRYIKNDLILKEKSSGLFTYRIPAKGHYKLFLSQYNATHISYVIYPGGKLFYLNKKAIPMNGIMLQDNSTDKNYPNKYLAFPAPEADSIYFSNLYYNCINTIRLFTPTGMNLPVNSNRQPYLNAARNPSKKQPAFIFFSNSVFRWPPVLKNTAPYYFYLKSPVKN